MSDSVAALRKGVGDDLRDLAEQHYKHELGLPRRARRLQPKGLTENLSPVSNRRIATSCRAPRPPYLATRPSAPSSASAWASLSPSACAETDSPTSTPSRRPRDRKASSSRGEGPQGGRETGKPRLRGGKDRCVTLDQLPLLTDSWIEKIPDITPLLRPTPLGDFATYTFLSVAGVFFGGETGLLAGSAAATRSITQDPAARKRIEDAFRRFKADALRRQADELDRSGEGGGVLFG